MTVTANVSTPPLDGANDFYIGNRPPLKPNPLLKLPPAAVQPQGWLKTQLVLESEGMVGRLPEWSHWCLADGNAWVEPKGWGKDGWEELPYWLKGYGDLGYVLGDERIIRETKRWIEGVLTSQGEDGYFGPRANKKNHDLWPNMVMLNVLQTYYEWSKDERILPFLSNYFKWQLTIPEDKLLPPYWQKQRAGDNLQSIYWLYNRTGEDFLLELAPRIHRRTAPWTDRVASWHGVNIAQCFRQPGIFYQQSWDPTHLFAAERNYQEVRRRYGQVPGGLYGADENCREGYDDPRQAAETCSMVEMMLSQELLLGISGNPIHADRCEDVAFNSLPAAFTPNLDGLHYLTAPNMVQLDREDKSPGLQNGGCMLAYSPDARYRCCQHNVSHGWPYFTEHLWMATRDNGLAAAIYSPCSVQARVGSGARVRIEAVTHYPFDDTMTFTVHLPEPDAFPLYFRVPGWCQDVKLSINEQPVTVDVQPFSYIRIERAWREGDVISLQLAMKTSLRTWPGNHNSVSVDRGPLTYSLLIGEEWKPFGDREDWRNWEVYPTTAWNYALELGDHGAESLEFIPLKASIEGQPFTTDNAPVKLRAKGRKVPQWQMRDGLVGLLQDSPLETDEPVEDLTLIPMGCARLRISSFPVVGHGEDAVESKAPPAPPFTASHVHDQLEALDDWRKPESSAGFAVPRFTWWPHKGTTEWVTRLFDKPTQITASGVYWFDDTGSGECRVPKSWRLLYREGDEWKEIAVAGDYSVEKDKINLVVFEPIITSQLRLEANLQDGFSSGILEWEIR